MFSGKTILIESPRLPGRPQEPQESSQELPEELQSLQEKEFKNASYFYQRVNLFWNNLWVYFGAQQWPKTRSKKLPRMEPVLERLAPHLRDWQIGKTRFLRGCRTGTGWLEIYPTKKGRDVLCIFCLMLV